MRASGLIYTNFTIEFAPLLPVTRVALPVRSSVRAANKCVDMRLPSNAFSSWSTV